MEMKCVLKKSNLEEFKRFLDKQGIAHRPGKGPSQVLQVMTKNGFRPVFKKKNLDEYYAVQDQLATVVLSFLNYSEPEKAEYKPNQFIVINKKHLDTLFESGVDFYSNLADSFRSLLIQLSHAMNHCGIKNNRYYVVNQDEEYASKILDIILEEEAKKRTKIPEIEADVV